MSSRKLGYWIEGRRNAGNNASCTSRCVKLFLVQDVSNFNGSLRKIYTKHKNQLTEKKEQMAESKFRPALMDRHYLANNHCFGRISDYSCVNYDALISTFIIGRDIHLNNRKYIICEGM